MTSAPTHVPIGPVTGLFANIPPDQFGTTVDELFSSARAISNAVVDEVEQDKITTTQGAAVIANVTGCLFGWPEFHRETRPSDLALMQMSQIQGQVHGDGQ